MKLKQNLVSISTIAGTDDEAPNCKTDAVIATNKESGGIIVFVEAARKLLQWKRQEYKRLCIPIVTEWDNGTIERPDVITSFVGAAMDPVGREDRNKNLTSEN